MCKMNRKETTEFLGELLKVEKFNGIGKYWASEVSVDAFTASGKGGRLERLLGHDTGEYLVGFCRLVGGIEL